MLRYESNFAPVSQSFAIQGVSGALPLVAAASSGKAPLTPWIAKLWLTGAKFDEYLSNPELESPGVLAQLYSAAKAEPISCDFGSDAFADALDV